MELMWSLFETSTCVGSAHSAVADEERRDRQTEVNAVMTVKEA